MNQSRSIINITKASIPILKPDYRSSFNVTNVTNIVEEIVAVQQFKVK